MDENKKISVKVERLVWFALLAILILWSLPLVNRGIDVRDTGSYLTKYRYIFDQSMKVNEIHYFLGEVMGGIIYALTPVRKLLALNIASSVLYVASALLLYYGLRKYLSKLLLMLCVLIGTFYSITWIRTLNWNAWTSLWLTLGLLLLMKGLATGSQKYLGTAGFVIAINTYFRFPNMLFLSLILVIFWKELLVILEEENWEFKKLFCWKYFWRAAKQCLWFFAGAVLAAGAGLILALVILGPDVVMGNLTMLTSVGAGENAENTHSITTGIYLFLLGMKDGAFSWIKYGVVLAAGALGAGVLEKQVRKSDATALMFRKVSVIRIAAMLLAGVFGLWPGLCADILRAHEWVAFGAIAFGIAGAFYYGKRDKMLSCLCVSAVAIEGFLTIGTDTGVNFYRVYMGLPLALLMILAFRVQKEASLAGKAMVANFCRMAAVFTLVFVMLAGIRYASTHVYHDAPNSELTTGINHPDYTGIKTSPERAAALNRLMEELKPYEEEKLLQIGCFNVGVVLTDMKPFFGSSWPDLEYLPMADFEAGLDEAIENGKLPVLLLGTLEESGMNWSPSKFARIKELGESELYQTLYVDEIYTIYVPVK